jgi:hypothetical protein
MEAIDGKSYAVTQWNNEGINPSHYSSNQVVANLLFMNRHGQERNWDHRPVPPGDITKWVCLNTVSFAAVHERMTGSLCQRLWKEDLQE